MMSFIYRCLFNYLLVFHLCLVPAYSYSFFKNSRAKSPSALFNMSGPGLSTSALCHNWRTISKDASTEEVKKQLSIHEPWSEEHFRDSLNLYREFLQCKDSYVASLIEEALCTLDHAYRLYGPRSVICSYNGGKDAVVILHLVRAALAHFYEKQRETRPDLQPERPRVIYFNHKDEFPEILKLLGDTVRDYDLDMIAFDEGISFSEGLKLLVVNNVVPSANQPFPMSFVLGTRASDPNAGNQGHFAPSSHWMPPFMRVNPILDWNYGHVWHFLRVFRLPYCVLYDQGYTSLGTTRDTKPNPALAVAGVSPGSTTSVPRFWPAFMLQDWDLERAGRIKEEKEKQEASAKASMNRSDSQKSLEVKSRLSTITDIGAAENVSAVPAQVLTAVMAPPSDESIADTQEESFLDSDGMQRSVGLLIIGDEILKGMTADQNTQVAAQALREHGVPLKKVAIVSDCQDAIVAEIKRLQRDVDVIITSGGVGPTHDDVTIKSVADSMEKEMVFHEGMAKLLREKMNKESDKKKSAKLTPAQTKMATLPSNAKLRYISSDNNDWPTLQCHNIFVLPGVPQFFARKMKSLAVYLSSQLERSETYKVVLSVDETRIVPILNRAVERHPDVSFGSYPFFGQPDVKTVLTLEGRLVEGGLNRSISQFLASQDISQQNRMTKEQMDRNVKNALDELINELDILEKGCILRVDNNDGMLFT